MLKTIFGIIGYIIGAIYGIIGAIFGVSLIAIVIMKHVALLVVFLVFFLPFFLPGFICLYAIGWCKEGRFLTAAFAVTGTIIYISLWSFLYRNDYLSF
jgi:hypothetical protein